MTPSARAPTKRDLLAEEFLRFLAIERNASPRTLKAYASALSKIREQLQLKPWLKCRADDFRDYLVSSLERKSGPQLYPAPVFSPAHLLQIFACSKKTRARSQCRSAVAKAAKAIADRAYPATNGRASFRPIAREKTIRPLRPGCRCAMPPFWNYFTVAVCA